MEKCSHLEDFLNEQRIIIYRHIDKHKYYNGIANREDAMNDFIKKYAWVMREMYCDKICPEKDNCEVYQSYLTKTK